MNLRAILSLPGAYRIFQSLVGVHRLRVEYVAEYAGWSAHDPLYFDVRRLRISGRGDRDRLSCPDQYRVL